MIQRALEQATVNAASEKPCPRATPAKAPASLAPVVWNSNRNCSKSLSPSDSRPDSLACLENLTELSKQRCCSGCRNIAVLGANPVNAFAVRVRFGRRFVRGSLANGIHLLDATFVRHRRRPLAARSQPISWAIFASASSESPYLSSSSPYLSVRASHSFRNFS